MLGQIRSLGESSDGGTSFPGTYDHDTNADTPAIEGTFKCAGDNCTLSYTGSGDDVDGHGWRPATRFPEAGKALTAVDAAKIRRPTTSSSVSGWMKQGDWRRYLRGHRNGWSSRS